jgi:YHS domain-containing protein
MKGDDSRIVKDPICGKDVDTLRARAVGIFGGVTYYFCSQECKAKYVDPRQSAAEGRQPTAPERRRETGERKSAEPDAQTEAPPVKYAHSRMRRVTGEVGTPVVQIDLSPNKKPAPAAPPPEASASDDDLQPARSGRGWAWLAIVMLLLAGGVVFYMLKFR